jgi:hypothetical protein
MNSVIELLQQTEGAIFVNEDSLEDSFEVLPALSNEELERFQVSLPCSLPEEIRELLTFASGFKVGGLEEVWFAAEGVWDGGDFPTCSYAGCRWIWQFLGRGFDKRVSSVSPHLLRLP